MVKELTRKMKDSGVEWIGEIPEDWELVRISSVVKERSDKVSSIDYEPLSVTKQGVVPQLEGVAKSNNPNDRKKVIKGDFVINSRSDRKQSCGIAPVDGSVSLINIILKLKRILPEYTKYLLDNYGFAEEFYRWGTGIVDDLWSTNYEKMKRIIIPLPPQSQQKSRADFLDKKVSEIDNIISKTKKAIEEYKRYKQSLITETVTKGLDENVQMKDSGIEWIGEIPENWDIVKFKRLFRILNGKEIKNELNRNSENAIKVYGSGGVFKYTDDFLHNKTSILFGRKGTIGKPVIAEGKFWTVDTMYYTDIIHGNLKYIYYMLKAFPWEIITTQTALPSITSTDLLNKYMSVAPFKEQEQIASYLNKKTNQIDQIISTKEKLL
ncbi:MAG: restriction endonuclease subunit S, partial [Tissierellia bacterium]|nr:restriction endonuclease subunit S [Tissierellia bacterium]